MVSDFVGELRNNPGKKLRFLKSGLKNLDFSNLGGMFGLFQRAPTKSETTLVNQLLIQFHTPAGQIAAPPLSTCRFGVYGFQVDFQGDPMGGVFLQFTVPLLDPSSIPACTGQCKNACTQTLPRCANFPEIE